MTHQNDLTELELHKLKNWDSFLTSIDNIEIDEKIDQFITNTYDATEENTNIDIKSTIKICHSCNIELIMHNNILLCSSCGVEANKSANLSENDYINSSINECNVNSNGFIAMKIVGKGSYGYQRNLLKTCANYSQFRKINTLKDMNNWNNNSKKHHIPKNVIQEANEMFAKIKEHGYVFRKDGKKGVLSSCIYYACYNNGISKTPSEIAHFSGIEEKFHSLGDRILHDLNEKGIIEIPVKVQPINDYVDRYLEILNIPKKYKNFIIALIDRAEKKNIHMLHDSKNNTKSCAAIYVLIERIPALRKSISKDLIEKECNISRTTFIRYYNLICTYYKKFKKVFKRHQIPMPRSWKN